MAIPPGADPPWKQPIGNETLWRITATGSRAFCAGLIVAPDGLVARSAPILFRIFFGQPIAYVQKVCAQLHWILEKVEDQHDL